MMNNLFLLFLSLSVSGSLVALVLFLLKPLLRQKTGKGWQYYIYLIVVLRLLIPFSPEFSFMGKLFSQAENNPTFEDAFPPALEEKVDAPERELSLPLTPQTLDTGEQPGQSAMPVGHSVSWHNLPPYSWTCWAAIALALFARKWLLYLRTTRAIRSGSRPVDHPFAISLYQHLGNKMNIRRLPPLRCCNLVAAPILVGTFHPIIVLPEANLDKDGLPYILVHELTHHKRRDILYKWLVQIAVCLHWFNPVVYWVRREVERGCELSCDEAVVKPLHQRERNLYGDTLLAVIESGIPPLHSLPSASLNGDKHLIKERLHLIAHYRRRSLPAACCSAILTLLLCGAAFTATPAVSRDIPPAESLSQVTKQSERTVTAPMEVTPLSLANVDAMEGYRKLSRSLDGAGIENLVISAQICALQVDPSPGTSIEAIFYYPEGDAANYESYFDLSLRREEGNTAIIATEYDDHGFDIDPASPIVEDAPPGVLVIRIPEKHYNNVRINGTILKNDVLHYNIPSSSLDLNIRVVDWLTFKTNQVYDQLTLNLYVGNLVFEADALGGSSTMDVEIGLLSLELAKEPGDLDFTLNRGDNSKFALPDTWETTSDSDTVHYQAGVGATKLTITNKRLGIFEMSCSGIPTSSAIAPDVSAVQSQIGDRPTVHTDLNTTQAVVKGDFSHSSGDYFKNFRIDVVDSNGYDHQAMVYICEGSDSYTKPFRDYLEALRIAYPGDYGFIAGYTDTTDNHLNRTYRQMDVEIEFVAVESVIIVDNNGDAHDAVVVVEDGAERFVDKRSRLFSDLYDIYVK